MKRRMLLVLAMVMVLSFFLNGKVFAEEVCERLVRDQTTGEYSIAKYKIGESYCGVLTLPDNPSVYQILQATNNRAVKRCTKDTETGKLFFEDAYTCNNENNPCNETGMTADCLSETYCENINYSLQDIENQKAANKSYVCIDKETRGQCINGKVEEVEKCTGDQVCNMLNFDTGVANFFGVYDNFMSWRAQCKTLPCKVFNTNYGFEAIHCVDGDVKKCGFNGWEMVTECGNNQNCNDDVNTSFCQNKDEIGCINQSGRRDVIGGSICIGDDIYNCIRAPDFNFSKTCEGDDECREYKMENNSGIEAKCVNKSTPTGDNEITGGTSVNTSANVYNPQGSCKSNEIAVANWCFPYDAGGIASKLLQIIFGIAGGIAFLLMVYGFIMVATSSGDEKKLQAARETITSAITGLLISLFALFLFRLIAINILQIPGLV